MGLHPTVEVVINGQSVQVDIELAELVDLVNQAGLHTEDSCQEGEDGRASISFVSSADAEAFLNVAASEPGTEITGLWNRINHTDEPEDFPPFDMWSYFSAPWDAATDWIKDGENFRAERTGPPRFAFWMMVLFPRSDIARLVELMRRHIA